MSTLVFAICMIGCIGTPSGHTPLQQWVIQSSDGSQETVTVFAPRQNIMFVQPRSPDTFPPPPRLSVPPPPLLEDSFPPPPVVPTFNMFPNQTDFGPRHHDSITDILSRHYDGY